MGYATDRVPKGESCTPPTKFNFAQALKNVYDRAAFRRKIPEAFALNGAAGFA
jgi:hypothetical protein